MNRNQIKPDPTYEYSLHAYHEILSELLVEIAYIEHKQGPKAGRLIILREQFEKWRVHYFKLIQEHEKSVSKGDEE